MGTSLDRVVSLLRSERRLSYKGFEPLAPCLHHTTAVPCAITGRPPVLLAVCFITTQARQCKNTSLWCPLRSWYTYLESALGAASHDICTPHFIMSLPSGVLPVRIEHARGICDLQTTLFLKSEKEVSLRGARATNIFLRVGFKAVSKVILFTIWCANVTIGHLRNP